MKADSLATVDTKLNASERTILAACEATIQRNLASFIEIGTALEKIRDKRLYRDTHKTFEEYVKERWEFQKNYAHKLIAAASVVAGLCTIVPKPTTEGVARELGKVDEDKRTEVWEAAVAKAEEEDKPVTAAIVEAVAEEIVGGWKCPNCGATERDDDGDCAKCKEPPAKRKAIRQKEATPADLAKAQIKVWEETIGRWLGKDPRIDDYRAMWPGKTGDAVLDLAGRLYETLKKWPKEIK